MKLRLSNRDARARKQLFVSISLLAAFISPALLAANLNALDVAALPGDRDRDLDRELMEGAARRERDREREMDRDRTHEMPISPTAPGMSGAGAGAGAGSRGGLSRFGDRRSSGRRSTTDSFVELFSDQVRVLSRVVGVGQAWARWDGCNCAF